MFCLHFASFVLFLSLPPRSKAANPEVQTTPLNFEEIGKRLDDLKITREDRARLKNHEFNSASDSDSDNSLSLRSN